MINISDSARDRLLHIMQQEKEEKPFVRVGVESGGCSGLSYKLDFDASKKEDDELITKSLNFISGNTCEINDRNLELIFFNFSNIFK